MLTSVISPMRMHLNDRCPHMCFSLIVSFRYCASLLSVRQTRTHLLIDYRRVEGKLERGPQSFVHRNSQAGRRKLAEPPISREGDI